MKSEAIKVLLIDDDEDDYILTREALSNVRIGKYELDWAPSYEEGLKVAARQGHDVCLVDYRLGEHSGVQLIREARASGLTTPMILLTGQGSHEVDLEAMQAGAIGYLIKEETATARLERTIRYAIEINTEHSRAEEALGAYAQKHAAVAEIGRLALIGTELKELFAEAVSLVTRTLRVEYCQVLELLPDGEELLLKAGVGWKEEFIIGQATVSAAKESQAGFTLSSDEPVIVEDLRTETRFSSPLLLEHKVVSGISFIIRGRECPYGVLGAHTTSSRRFTTDDVNFLRSIANVLAEAIGRKVAEDEVRKSEARFRSIVESNMLGILFGDDSGNITGANDALLDMLGYTRDDLAAGRILWREMTPPEYRKRDEKALEELAASGVCETFEKEFIRKDGSRLPILLGLARLEGDGQRAVGFVLNITERKQAETERAGLVSELESERARLVNIFTHAPAIIAVVHGPEHIFELANDRYYDHVGRRGFIGRSVRDALPELEQQGFLELLDKVYTTGVAFSANEMPIEFANGVDAPRELHYVNFIYQPLTDVNGTVSGILCHGVDVTEQVLSRRRLEETENQLRQSQKLESVGMLAGGIAHDFNNLLTVITGYSELMLRRLDKADPFARNVEEIKKAAERAGTLTRQLLAFSRKQVLQPKVLDLNTVIVNIEKMLGRLIGEDMELLTSPGAGLGKVKADPGQIEQVILNLVVNARDAMPQGGKITIETANIYLDEAYAHRHIAVQPGWYAMLAVTDTGCGMDAETQKNIFEPFFTTKEQGKGTGLGLSTVYGIVKQSGGNLWVYSETGVGTTFKIYLPLVDEPVTAPDVAATRPKSLLGTETILLAEDEEMVRNLACESLKMNGYTVLEAANAGEALVICQQHVGPIHLLLTDVVMPRMSGRELAEQLVKLRPEMSVLYMSGYPDQSIVHHGILDEDLAFIGKPFTPDTLVRKVVEVLQQM
jgi:PAS domain S-box-containing protein